MRSWDARFQDAYVANSDTKARWPNGVLMMACVKARCERVELEWR